jgi:hypothetical protein
VESCDCHPTILQVPLPDPLSFSASSYVLWGQNCMHVLHVMECVYASTTVPIATHEPHVAARVASSCCTDGDAPMTAMRTDHAGVRNVACTTPKRKTLGP